MVEVSGQFSVVPSSPHESGDGTGACDPSVSDHWAILLAFVVLRQGLLQPKLLADVLCLRMPLSLGSSSHGQARLTNEECRLLLGGQRHRCSSRGAGFGSQPSWPPEDIRHEVAL